MFLSMYSPLGFEVVEEGGAPGARLPPGRCGGWSDANAAYWLLRFLSRKYSRSSLATLMMISRAKTHFAGLMMSFTICSASPPPGDGICPKTAAY